ncbi:hypothetical protein C8255_10675 [filamentous cyanobacterium CCP3]|nr:hypothetical protein C8255_10675 [filamentous cyanobacterium CCP3]
MLNKSTYILFTFTALLGLYACETYQVGSSTRSLQQEQQSSPKVIEYSDDTSDTSLSNQNRNPDVLSATDNKTELKVNHFPKPAKLVAEDINARINLSARPSAQADSRGYGLVGDAVTLLNMAQDDQGQEYYQVKFDTSGAEGWIESSFIKIRDLNESLIQIAQIGQEDTKALIQLDGARVDATELRKDIFEVILPGYIPDGYELRQVLVQNGDKYQTEAGAYTTLAGYSLTYRDANNHCFTVGAYIPPSGAPVEIENIEVYSPALGNLLLTYAEFDEYTGQAKIQLDAITGQPDGYVYEFTSPGYRDEQNELCKTINLQEAIKIVESMDFINERLKNKF